MNIGYLFFVLLLGLSFGAQASENKTFDEDSAASGCQVHLLTDNVLGPFSEYSTGLISPYWQRFFKDVSRAKLAIIGTIPADKNILWIFVGDKGSSKTKYAFSYDKDTHEIISDVAYDLSDLDVELILPTPDKLLRAGVFPRIICGYSTLGAGFLVFGIGKKSLQLVAGKQWAPKVSINQRQDIPVTSRSTLWNATYVDAHSLLIRGTFIERISNRSPAFIDYFFADFLASKEGVGTVAMSHQWRWDDANQLHTFLNTVSSELLSIQVIKSDSQLKGLQVILREAKPGIQTKYSELISIYDLMSAVKRIDPGSTFDDIRWVSGRWEDANTLRINVGFKGVVLRIHTKPFNEHRGRLSFSAALLEL